jgi:DNA-binding XRE family transcriptional regulator
MNPSIVPLRVLIRQRRKELGLSQSRLAEDLSVTSKCITSWESGCCRMELGKLPRLAAVLQLDLWELCQKRLAGVLSGHPRHPLHRIRGPAGRPSLGALRQGRFRYRAEPVEVVVGGL